MDEQAIRAPHFPSGWWAEAKPILLLLVLATALRAWQLAHTEVPSRDTLGYVHMAWRMEREPWAQVLRGSFQHPGYPVTILALSGPVRSLLPGDLPLAMQVSAQLASAIASVLLVVPLFLLGRELFDRRACFWAVLLFQCLPATGRLMGDGLSEPLFVLCVSTALLAAARGLRTGAVGWFVAAGVASGLAYLTRVEGIVALGVSGLVLTALWLAGRWSGGWRRWLVCGHALVVPALALALPFMLAIGGVSNKPTAREITDPNRQAEAMPLPVVSGPLLLAKWAPEWRPGGNGSWVWALQTLPGVLARGFFFVFWVPALLGLWWYRDRWPKEPAAWLLLLTAALIGAAVARVGAVLGYISDRHLILIVLAGLYWAAAALLLFADGMAAWVVARRPSLGGVPCWSLLALGVCCAVPLVKTMEPLHQDRDGFRQAGYWLAEHAAPEDEIIDPYCWASYYAGRGFRETEPAAPARYVVIEDTGNKHSHLPEVSRAVELAKQKGRLVQRWKVARGEVQVYRVGAPDRSSP